MSEKTIDFDDLINSEIQSYTTFPKKGKTSRLFSHKNKADLKGIKQMRESPRRNENELNYSEEE
jgi:hypothetical protein